MVRGSAEGSRDHGSMLFESVWVAMYAIVMSRKYIVFVERRSLGLRTSGWHGYEWLTGRLWHGVMSPGTSSS